jgi:hypothetical protein
MSQQQKQVKSKDSHEKIEYQKIHILMQDLQAPQDIKKQNKNKGRKKYLLYLVKIVVTPPTAAPPSLPNTIP